MGILTKNLQLQLSRLLDIEDRLEDLDPTHVENIDLAIEELEEEVSNAVDALDRLDNGEEEDDDCDPDDEEQD